MTPHASKQPGARILTAILLAAVSSAAAGTPQKQRPACDVELLRPNSPDDRSRDVLIRVGDRRLSLGPRDIEPAELRVYGADDDSVFVAYAGETERGPNGSDRLWRVSCSSGEPATAAHQEGADFGHSAPTRDGRGLFYSGPDGVYRFDFSTGASQRLTQASSDYCAKNEVPARDVVIGWADPAGLLFQRGCGLYHTWTADEMLLTDPGTPRMAIARAPRKLQLSIAADADGGLWLADAACDSASTLGRVLYSSDLGENWRRVTVEMPVAQPVRQILADPEKGGRLLVVSIACGSSQHVDPAWAFVTEDGGRTFRSITVPEGIPSRNGAPAPERDPLRAIVAPDGSLDRLLLYGDSPDVAGGKVGCWESRDAGRTWAARPPVEEAPAAQASAARVGDVVFAVRGDGVYRSRPRGPERRIFPPKRLPDGR